jgi:L-seryl-tRNA(Ser) seleniumtransferase
VATRFDVPLLEDQGSGWLGLDVVGADAFPVDARRVLAREPSVRESIAAGVDLVAFSGDKLLGGPQCGVVVGRRALVEQVRRHPLMRAVRVDKMTYAALEHTLLAYRRGRAHRDVPVLAMLAATPESLAARAEAMARRLSAAGIAASCREGQSAIGGGTTPGETLPTTLVSLHAPDGADALLRRLRGATLPVIGRIVDEAVCLDLRTVPAADDGVVAETVEACF